MTSTPKRILVIRRDNIGDLVCTTPLFSSLRKHFPDAYLAALVNSYNAPVLHGNPEIDEVFVYRKFKHAGGGESRFSVWLETWRLLRRLRAKAFDLAIVATPVYQASALKFARWIKPGRIIAYGDAGVDLGDRLAVLPPDLCHETQAVLHLLSPLGIREEPGPVRVFAETAGVPVPDGDGPLIGLHISARKPSQRWSIDRFKALAERLHATCGARFLLFWAPGSESNKLHPGDDAKAAALTEQCRGLPFMAYPTRSLPQLIAGLSACDYLICSDGGAMHLAAGLGKPILCFFGNSGATHWRPWGVEHRLLQPSSLNVIDISVDEALAAFDDLSHCSGERP